MEKNEKILKVKKGRTKHSEVEIEAEISPETLSEHKKLALAEFKKNFVMPGFRKGMVPENIVLQNLNADSLLHEAAESALRELYPEIIEMAEVAPITPPEVHILKLAEGNPLEVKLRVAVRPEVKLPNYKKIAKKAMEEKEKPAVEEKELEEVIARLRQMQGGETAKADAELTDEEVKKFGKFESVADFKAKLKENLISEKEHDINKRARSKMVRDIVDGSDLELPPMFVALELADLKEDFEKNLKENGETLEKFLERTGKTAEGVDSDHKEYVERSLKTKFVLSEILRAENITADPGEMEKEVTLMRSYRPDMSDEHARAYAESMILNEKLFAMLEGEEKKEEEK
jgi:FKBP-type peptidyl-prolyl cis-trans isomerase (trigger factor)